MIVREEDMERGLRHDTFGAEGAPAYRVLLDPKYLKGEAKMLNYVEFKPGEGLGLHTHSDNFEIVYILEGKAEVNDNGTLVEVGPGDLIYTASGDTHAVTNTGDTTLKTIATVIYENKCND